MDLFPPEEEVVTTESLFPPEDEVEQQVQKTKKYKLALAERYAYHTNKPVEETLTAVEKDSATTLFEEKVTPDAIIEKAYSEKQPIDLVKVNFDNFSKYLETKYSSGDSIDLVDSITSVDPIKDYQKNEDITMAIIHDAYQRAAPEDGVVNTGLSFLGMLGYEATVGTVQNFLGVTGTSIGSFEGRAKTGMEAYEEIRMEPNITRKIELANARAAQAKAQGLFDDNTFLYWQDYQNVTQKGLGQREGFWFGVDIAALSAGKAIKAVKGVANATGISTKLAIATDPLEATEAVGGKSAANTVMETALVNPTTAVNTAKHSAPSTSSAASNGMGPTIKPVLANEVVNNYKEIVETSFKDMYTPEQIKGAVDRYAETLKKNNSFHVLDVEEKNLGFDNFSVKVTLGREDGLPFKDWANAQKFNKTLGGTVEPYGLSKDGKNPEGYVISFERNLSLKGMATPTELASLRSFLFDYVASPEVTSSANLTTMLKRGQDKIGYIQREIMDNHERIKSKISKEDNDGISLVINKLNTENPLNGEWYDLATFRDIFYQQTGRKATKEVEDAYVSSWKITDTARLLEADKTLKRFSSSKAGQFVGSFDGSNFYRMNKLPAGALPQTDKYAQKYVWDAKTNKPMEAKEFFKRAKKENLSLFQIVDVEKAPMYNGNVILYATGSLKASRPLIHSDVLPKIAGGFRDTTNIKGFLVSPRTATDLSGNTVNMIPRFVFAARTDKELTSAAKELNTLLKGYRDVNAGSLSRADFENLVKNNNGFNPNIEDMDSFEAFLKNADIGDSDVQIVTKDMNLPEVGIGFFDNYRSGKFQTYDDAYSKGEITNRLIYGYGAGKFKHLDVGTVIERDFAKGINYMAEREYSYNALEGFVKTARDNKLILNERDIKDKSIVDQIKEMRLADNKLGDKLQTERRVILNRLHETNVFAQKWNRRMTEIGEFIFDKSKGKFDVIDKMSFQPDVALRSFAFDMKLGLFNPDQFLVQASSAIGIMAIDPINGLKAAASYLPMRVLLTNSSPEVAKATYKRVKAFIGMSEKEFMEWVDYGRKSGFLEVNQNISELNNTYNITKGVINKTRELGRTPFKEGDRVARIMASNVAYRQFRQAYPTLDVTTSAGAKVMSDFMTKRYHAMTMNMSRASAAAWQKGWMSIPTQWLSYQAKLMESIFFSRELTGLERARLAATQVLFFGAAGVPMGSYIVNAFTDDSTEGIDKDAYTFLRYGILDYTLSNLIGEDTAMSGRLGAGGSWDQVYEDVLDKNFAELIGGPSGSIAYDTVRETYGLLKGAFTQDVSITQYDLTKVLRHISTANKAVQGLYLMQSGEFINKKGVPIAEGMSPWNALWNTLGIPFQEVSMYYDVRNHLQTEKEMVLFVTDRVRELRKIMINHVNNDDMESAKSVEADIASLMAPLSEDQYREVTRFSMESRLSTRDSILKRMKRVSEQGLAIQYQKLLEKEGQ